MFQLLFSTTLLLAGGASSAETTPLGGFEIPARNSLYGGFSALHIGDNGTSFLAMSDRRGFITGTITRDTDGQIETIALDPPVRVQGYQTDPPPTIEDAEGVAVAPDGTLYVSFEQDHRIGKFTVPSAPEIKLPTDDMFAALPKNNGLEALAINAAGALFAIPESTCDGCDTFPIYRYENGQWDIPFAIPSTRRFRVVGADFAPDGRLYLLERRFGGIGFFTRVRRIDLAAQTSETILETGIGTHGNMEGISVWENAAGDTVMTLIADDNFQRILSNEIAEYRIDG